MTMKGLCLNLSLFIGFLSYCLHFIEKIPEVSNLNMGTICFFILGSFLIFIIMVFIPTSQKYSEFKLTLKLQYLGFCIYCSYYLNIIIISLFFFNFYIFSGFNIKIIEILSILFLVKNGVLHIMHYYNNINDFSFNIRERLSFILNFILISYFLLNNQSELNYIFFNINIKDSIFVITITSLLFCFIIRFIFFIYNINYSNTKDTNTNKESYFTNLCASFISFLITYCIMLIRLLYLKHISLLKSIEIIGYKIITISELEFFFIFLIISNMLFIFYLTMLKNKIKKNPFAKIELFEIKWVLIVAYLFYFSISILILRPFFFDIFQVIVALNEIVVSPKFNNFKYHFFKAI